MNLVVPLICTVQLPLLCLYQSYVYYIFFFFFITGKTWNLSAVLSEKRTILSPRKTAESWVSWACFFWLNWTLWGWFFFVFFLSPFFFCPFFRVPLGVLGLSLWPVFLPTAAKLCGSLQCVYWLWLITPGARQVVYANAADLACCSVYLTMHLFTFSLFCGKVEPWHLIGYHFWRKDSLLGALTQGNAFGLASAQNLLRCCFNTTSFLKPSSKKRKRKKNLFSLMSEVMCNAMVCLIAICPRLLPLHLVVLLYIICFILWQKLHCLYTSVFDSYSHFVVAV